jgi:DmsE family decaheme c-type cytochrome
MPGPSENGEFIMPSIKRIKVMLLGIFALLAVAWFASGTFYTVLGTSTADELTGPPASAKAADGDYVGSETCAACHEDQFKTYSRTKHSKLGEIKSWKDKVQGCESCHRPGKAHVEGSGDKSKIINPQNLDAKASSETCLTCHAGKETHNNFRRGEHWRNNVGCNDCHTAHPGGVKKVNETGSMTLIKEQPDTKLLKQGEPQLCLSCHNEQKSAFTKPFHHKVLEGTMKCSDCHNAHGGFETKQTKLAVGIDQSCVKCHSNKQGPFVFEHAPLKLEGCTVCHIPHGSANPKMLKRATVRQLCMECHTGLINQLSPEAGNHNQALVRYQQCTVCHSAIHGSNSSSLLFR